ncbi:hypothetical protein [Pedobacter sp. B4-66]|uniref:hypothetical protein n=1 Tax=Pedobacter sp. B4-66 TaxID=2817280 RepID=UPI001BDB1A26|nr:hypothetical protein [Pedobacter sp. B4-66]
MQLRHQIHTGNEALAQFVGFSKTYDCLSLHGLSMQAKERDEKHSSSIFFDENEACEWLS